MRAPLVGVAAGLLLLGAGCGGPAPARAAGSPPALLCGDTNGPACRLELVATEPDDGVQPLLDRFAAATTSIDYVPFELDEPRIVAALGDASRRGVRVRVSLEPSPNGDRASGDRALLALLAVGAEVRPSNPAFALTHAKYAVVDGTEALILTFNSTAAHLASRRDFAVSDVDPGDVRFVQALFDADWDGDPTPAIPPGFAISPENSNEVLVGLVGSARRTLDVYAEKLEPSPTFDAITAAAQRGVRVRILAAPVDAKESAIGLLRRSGLGDGLQIRIPRTPRVHAKVILADGATVFVGSENVQDGPQERRRELGIVFASRPLVTDLGAVFERDWAAPAEVVR